MTEKIIIITSQKNEKEYRDIRCLNCGRKMLRLNHKIKTVVVVPEADETEIIEKVNNNLIEHKCRGCDSLYTIIME
jgi:DNA-directed RNA polymerase subunit RPC12/RpoP